MKEKEKEWMCVWHRTWQNIEGDIVYQEIEKNSTALNLVTKNSSTDVS